jgi:hypothetical protein
MKCSEDTMNAAQWQPAPPAVQADAAARERLWGLAQWFALPIAGVALLLLGTLLLQGAFADRLALWLASLVAGLVALAIGLEALLWVRLRQRRRREVGAYDYAWIERAQAEQPGVAQLAKRCLVQRGVVTVADLLRLWRHYVAEQQRTVDHRRRAARLRCAQSLGLRPRGADGGGEAARRSPKPERAQRHTA